MTGRLMRTALLWAGLWGLVLPTPAARAEMARYDVDPDHTTIEFSVAHMVVSKTTGRFMDYTGYIEMDPEAKTVKTIEATIRTASVNTNHPKRDQHLRSPDFFHVEKYPTVNYPALKGGACKAKALIAQVDQRKAVTNPLRCNQDGRLTGGYCLSPPL